ncbi:MAG: hypothetical protein EKK53_28025 [Burkholderiales bacterium]|nr:MAG: hypothetical protein EKK53_28025 [Burkholderiales bacterium]
MKRLAPRQWLLLGLLALSLVATAWVAGRDEPGAVPAVARRQAAATPVGASAAWPGAAASARVAWPDPDAGALRAWGDAPPLPQAAAVPPANVSAAAPTDPAADEPPVPPFPYRLVGRLTDSQPRAVLDSAQRSLVLGVNDVVDGQWRIEAIEASGLRVKRLPDGPSQLIAFSPS